MTAVIKSDLRKLLDQIMEDCSVSRKEGRFLSDWLSSLDPPPELEDLAAIQHAVYEHIIEMAKISPNRMDAVTAIDAYHTIQKIILRQTQKRTKPAEHILVGVHFSNRWQAFSSELKRCCRKIDLAMYNITYEPVVDLLKELAARGVAIRILIDDENYPSPNSNNPKDGTVIRDLVKEQRIFVKIDTPVSLMHNKFVVIDDTTVLNGSANLTYNGMHHNSENIIVTRHPHIAEVFVGEFNRLWNFVAGE